MPEEKTLSSVEEQLKQDEPEAEEPVEVEGEISDKEISTEEYSDDSVVIKKSQLAQLEKDRTAGENYKKGFLSLKKQEKEKKEIDKQTKEKEVADGQFLKKDEFYKSIEKRAIAEACKDNDVDENWKDIVAYYSSRRGSMTVEDIVADIKDAKTLWRKDNPEEEDNKGKEETAKVATETQSPAGESKGKGKEKKGRRVLKLGGVKPENWYPKEE